MRSNATPVLTVFAGVLTSLLLLSGCDAQAVTLRHVHGLAYSADGKRLFVPSHDGLVIYESGRWSQAPGPQHDYMGFTATKGRFYSSGHPAPGSGLKNPFGLIVSTDGGQNWGKRGLEGESDFHVLGASYETNAVYVHTSEPISRMPRPGIYYTLNDRFSWSHAKAQGLPSAVQAVAVHPSDPKIVAVAAKEGLFLSKDHGNHFEALGAFFDLDGEHLLYSMYDGSAKLYRRSLKTGNRTEVPLPALTRDAVSYIAQNPTDRGEYAIATFERSIYLIRNMGKNWTQIAQNGQSK